MDITTLMISQRYGFLKVFGDPGVGSSIAGMLPLEDCQRGKLAVE